MIHLFKSLQISIEMCGIKFWTSFSVDFLRSVFVKKSCKKKRKKWWLFWKKVWAPISQKLRGIEKKSFLWFLALSLWNTKKKIFCRYLSTEEIAFPWKHYKNRINAEKKIFINGNKIFRGISRFSLIYRENFQPYLRKVKTLKRHKNCKCAPNSKVLGFSPGNRPFSTKCIYGRCMVPTT